MPASTSRRALLAVAWAAQLGRWTSRRTPTFAYEFDDDTAPPPLGWRSAVASVRNAAPREVDEVRGDRESVHGDSALAFVHQEVRRAIARAAVTTARIELRLFTPVRVLVLDDLIRPDHWFSPDTKGGSVSTIRFKQTTTLTPEQYIAGLTDFGPGRSKVFSNSADDYLKVDQAGPAQADVTEGSGGVWERLHYDWSNPDRVVLTTTDSNVWGNGSGYTYTFPPSPNGATEVNVIIVREGRTIKGRMLAVVLGSVGKGVLKKSFVNSVKAIEARNSAAPGR